jgi:hypothetical protein
LQNNERLSSFVVGIFRCEHCGLSLVNNNGYFRCSKLSHGTCEGCGTVLIKDAEALIVSVLEDLQSGQNIKTLKFDSPAKNVPPASEAASFQSLLDKATEKLSRIKSAYENGIDSIEEYKENKKRVLSEIEEIKRNMSSPESVPKNNTPDKKEFLKRVQQALTAINSDASPLEKREAVKLVISRVVKDSDNNFTFYFAP